MSATHTVRTAVVFCAVIVCVFSAAHQSPSDEDVVHVNRADWDFLGVYRTIERSPTAEAECNMANPLTDACTCPPGSLSNEESPLVYENIVGQYESIVFCGNASIPPRSFAGAFQTAQGANGQCIVPNVYPDAITNATGCFCPAGFHALSQEVWSTSHSATTNHWCVPNDNATIPGWFYGLYVTSCTVDHKLRPPQGNTACTPSNSNISGAGGFICYCPAAAANTWQYNPLVQENGGITNFGAFCFADCSQHTEEAGCGTLPFCTWCGGGRRKQGSCHRSDDNSVCCSNDAGFDVCAEGETCCASPGQKPNCCGSDAPLCDAATSRCSCSSPYTQCLTAGGGQYGESCCVPGASCCPAAFNEECCPAGTTCCTDHDDSVGCCDDKTEVCHPTGNICVPRNGTTLLSRNP